MRSGGNKYKSKRNWSYWFSREERCSRKMVKARRNCKVYKRKPRKTRTQSRKFVGRSRTGYIGYSDLIGSPKVERKCSTCQKGGAHFRKDVHLVPISKEKNKRQDRNSKKGLSKLVGILSKYWK